MEESEKNRIESSNLDRTREILLEKDITELKQELERRMNYERDYLMQATTEREIRHEQELNELRSVINAFSQKIEHLQMELESLKKEKVDMHQLAVVLSELSLQLMNKNEK